jgi:hypothetical protein
MAFTPEPTQTPFWQDKNVRMIGLLLVTLVTNTIGKKFGYALDPEAILGFALTVIGFIVAQKWKGAVVAKAAIAADSAEAQVKTLDDAAKAIAASAGVP